MCHPFSTADARDLLTEVSGGRVQGQRRIRLKNGRLPRIAETWAKSQGDQPAPAEKTNRSNCPLGAPPVAEGDVAMFALGSGDGRYATLVAKKPISVLVATRRRRGVVRATRPWCSSATNCSGHSKRTWTNPATDNWQRRGTLDRVSSSGAARHLQLRAGHHLWKMVGSGLL